MTTSPDKRPAGSRDRAFSLVEVVVAMGVFAIAVIVVLGLLPPATREVGETLDVGTAQRLAEAINAEVRRVGYDALVPALLVSNAELRDLADDDPRLFWADRDGRRVGDSRNMEGVDERYFEIVLVRMDDLSPPGADSTAGYVAFTGWLSWPARLPDGDSGGRVVARAQRSTHAYNFALTR
jgi:type II secretory pathway pseudopilin PulG